MQKIRYLAILSVFLWICSSARSEALTTTDLFQRYAPSVATLRVTRKDGAVAQGTGFLISSSGELLTNFHVLDNADIVEVYFSERLWYSAKRIVAQDPEKDLALLWIERVNPSLVRLELNLAKSPEGSDVTVIGTPRGFEKTITTGILSGYRKSGQVSLIQITAPISSGSSGSPVFDVNGRVIGIAIGAIKDSQGLNFAIDAKEIADFLRRRPFKTLAAAKPSSSASVSAHLSNTGASSVSSRNSVRMLSLQEILAKLELARPRSAIDRVKQNFGAPDRENERGKDYYLRLWDFQTNNAVLFVWDRASAVERSVWTEYYATKEEAASRAQSMSALAVQFFGQHSSASQSGKVWKRKDYSIGIEQQSTSTNHMVIFKATQ
jgi:hypothetical protein